MTAYQLDRLRFAYAGGAPVVDVPEFSVPAGQMTAFVGPNGCGKTTLLHLLAFLHPPTAGSLTFFGQRPDSRRLPALRRQVCLLLQTPYLFRRSVAANVEWGLRLRGKGRFECRELARQALQRVGLEADAGRPAGQLSGGERQRLALARVIALRPRVVCLDEPTNHLDRPSRAVVEQLLREWLAAGVTVVLATHDRRFAYRLGGGIWRMEAGGLVAEAVANVLCGQLLGGTPQRFQVGDVVLRVQDLPAESGCVLIPPRHILLARSPQQHSARNQLRGYIVAVTDLAGDELQVSMDCGFPLVAVITREAWCELGLAQGAEVVASFKASAVEAC